MSERPQREYRAIKKDNRLIEIIQKANDHMSKPIKGQGELVITIKWNQGGIFMATADAKETFTL